MKIDELKVRDCVGCGYCCLKTPCELARRLYPTLKTECPELIWNGSRYICRAFDKAYGSLKENIRNNLAIGAGCCCGLNSWRKEVIPRRPKDNPEQFQKIEIDPLFKTFLRAMSREMMGGDLMVLILGGMKSILEKEGKSKEEINEISKEIIYILKDRPQWIESFMG